MAPSAHRTHRKPRRRVIVIGCLVVVLSLAVLVIRSGAVVCTPSGTTTPILQLCKPSSGESGWATAINANWDLLDSFFGPGNSLKVANGGTGVASVATGKQLVGDGTNPLQVVNKFRRTVYTSGATFTVPAGVSQLYVQVFGAGGGGGGGGGGSNAYDGGTGGTGAHGGYADALISTTPSTQFTVTVGSDGNGGSGGPYWGSGAGGGVGGSTSFGSIAAASGGGGGGGGGAGTEGSRGPDGAIGFQLGAGTGGDVQITGNGRGPGLGGAGAPGGLGTPGSNGAAGQSGLVIVWY